jgi:hypothetical protein
MNNGNKWNLCCSRADYEEVIPREFLELAERYRYTCAIRNLMVILNAWASQRGVTTSYEYIYRWIDAKAQKVVVCQWSILFPDQTSVVERLRKEMERD